MHCRARSIIFGLSIAILATNAASAQVVMQPTATPTLTAENEPWYLTGEPVTHAGNLYYPAGPRVYFNANEMVRSGFHLGIPLYTRTTIEPYSVVYLPVGPGLLQPYERPRIGLLAETSGSMPPSLRPMPANRGPIDDIDDQVPTVVGTTGVAVDRSAAAGNHVAPVRRPTHTRIGGTPQGSNSIFIEFEGERYYKAGAAEPIDASTMSRAGTYAGIPVWSAPGRSTGIIYVPVTQQGGSLVVPYSKKRP